MALFFRLANRYLFSYK